MKINILLADDHIVMRDGLRVILEKERDLSVIAVAGDGREAVQLADEQNVDIVIMDINMPNMTGLEATRQIKANDPQIKILTLSVHTDNELVAKMIEAGASGYIPKSCAVEELVNAIRTVMNIDLYVSPTVVQSVVKYLQKKPEKTNRQGSALTTREREVVQLIAEGKTTKEIAEDLYISESTVESHRHKIMSKLEIRSIAELTKYAIRHGLTSLE
jgi:DNA-binding NarL/FixJ family response regulator